MHAANRLTQCAACGSFADKYVEYESALIALDMLLHRRSVYRHMLCNNTKSSSRVALLELVSALCLFDAYLKWLRLGGQPWISREACYDGVLPSIAMLWSVVPALLLSLAEHALFEPVRDDGEDGALSLRHFLNDDQNRRVSRCTGCAGKLV